MDALEWIYRGSSVIHHTSAVNSMKLTEQSADVLTVILLGITSFDRSVIFERGERGGGASMNLT